MSHEFDATFKDMAAQRPRDFLETFDGPTPDHVRSLNVDLSTVTTSADFLIGVGRPLREVVAIDFQSGASRRKAADVLVYNALLHRQYDVPVHSVLVLLRRAAQHSEVNGAVRYAPRVERGKMDFGYEIVRLWERSADSLISGPLGTAPLAVLGDPGPHDDDAEIIRGVVERLHARLRGEVEADEYSRLMTSAMLLSGLIYEDAVIRTAFRGVMSMFEDSTIYLSLIEEGKAKALRQQIVKRANKTLGPPDAPLIRRLDAIENPERLDRILDAVLDGETLETALAAN